MSLLEGAGGEGNKNDVVFQRYEQAAKKFLADEGLRPSTTETMRALNNEGDLMKANQEWENRLEAFAREMADENNSPESIINRLTGRG